MKPAANSQSRTSNTNSQPQTVGLPKNEPDSNDQNWDPNCPCGTAGRGVHLKLESGSAQISGKLCSFWVYFLLVPALHCLKQFGWKDNVIVFLSRTAAPPLPPKPSVMMPEYLTVLPSSISSPQSAQKSLLGQTDPPSPTSKGKKVQAFGMFFREGVHFNLVLLLSLTQDQLIKGSCPEILMWCLSVWEGYCPSKEVRGLL